MTHMRTLTSETCPIGQIEAATEAALARINGGEPAPEPSEPPKRTRKPKATESDA